MLRLWAGPAPSCRSLSSSSALERVAKRCHSSAAIPNQRRKGPRKVIFSGIQPTGIPHVGNYLGALQQWIKLQDEANAYTTELFFSVVDLHAMTVAQESRKALHQSRRETFATLLAVGLDPEKSTIFYQSNVPQHSELMWILSCSASVGYLSRMTQWKSKLELSENTNALESSSAAKLKLGLFSYPVLQAADILVHRATHVPVGEDQRQHLEFARECANGFNHLCRTPTLVAPETIVSPAKRVMALDRPTMKMSKSHPNFKSRIHLTDSKEVIGLKLKTALTDALGNVTYDPVTRPGVSNMIDIAFHLRGPGQASSPEEFATDFEGISLKAFKGRVADVVDSRIAPIREKYHEIMSNPTVVNEAASLGAAKATRSAERTMRRVRNALGLA